MSAPAPSPAALARVIAGRPVAQRLHVRPAASAVPRKIAWALASHHFTVQMRAKGFTLDQVEAALTNPDKVTDVTRYPGQERYCGAGVAVVVDGDRLITAYLDSVRTPLRPDQMSDPHALNSRRVGVARQFSGIGR